MIPWNKNFIETQTYWDLLYPQSPSANPARIAASLSSAGRGLPILYYLAGPRVRGKSNDYSKCWLSVLIFVPINFHTIFSPTYSILTVPIGSDGKGLIIGCERNLVAIQWFYIIGAKVEDVREGALMTQRCGANPLIKCNCPLGLNCFLPLSCPGSLTQLEILIKDAFLRGSL
jgi:hypothetical protein